MTDSTALTSGDDLDFDPASALAIATKTIRTEIKALEALIGKLDSSFPEVVKLVGQCEGHVIIAGVGKSGHIGQKIAASLASTGTPSFFLHPTEASHGDLGMLTSNCVVVAISYSGESRELVDLLRFCRNAGIPVVGLTRSRDSTLGRMSTLVLETPEVEEACPNGLAPTSSTTVTLALGDALTIAVMSYRGFSREEFGSRHPGGKLGRSLQTVEDFLSTRTMDLPSVRPYAPVSDVVIDISAGRHGCVAVTSDEGEFLGMITDGDIRRALAPQMFDKVASEVMTANPITFGLQHRMQEVVTHLTEKRVANAFVVENRRPLGVIHIKDLLLEGYI